jgi:hypothetical protein
MAIVLMTFSGSGLARSIDNSPFFRSAPNTCIPSASTKVRWKWRRDAAMDVLPDLVVAATAPDYELVFLNGYIELTT